jgi:hypothetical protein
MASETIFLVCTALLLVLLHRLIVTPLYLNPLSHIPGPNGKRRLGPAHYYDQGFAQPVWICRSQRAQRNPLQFHHRVAYYLWCRQWIRAKQLLVHVRRVWQEETFYFCKCRRACKEEEAAGACILQVGHPKEPSGNDYRRQDQGHLLAGIDTMSDTLMFLVWALSLPQHAHIQRRLVEECKSINADAVRDGVVDLDVADRLPYLDAVIKETLRLYAPLPASEPRTSPIDTVIDGYSIPRGTVCSMAPYSLHRNADVFPDPLKWDPERWLKAAADPPLAEMKKWCWPFSSGARMCIGLQ